MTEKFVCPHPAIPHLSGSAEYRIWLNGEEVFVPQIIGFTGGTVAFLPFTLTGPVDVRIQADRTFETAEVRPLSAGIPCRREGNTIFFTMDRPCNLFVRWDDGFELPVYLLASAPQKDIPSPQDAGVHYFGPGVHEGGVTRNVTFRNISILGGLHRPAYIQGMDDAHEIHHVAIENLTVHGRQITEIPEARLQIGEHVHHLSLS
jgi:hypothetical protein